MIEIFFINGGNNVYKDDEYIGYEVSDSYFRIQITGYRDIYYSWSYVSKIVKTVEFKQ